MTEQREQISDEQCHDFWVALNGVSVIPLRTLIDRRNAVIRQWLAALSSSDGERPAWNPGEIAGAFAAFADAVEDCEYDNAVDFARFCAKRALEIDAARTGLPTTEEQP